MHPKPWSDLSPDLLREIAGRLHIAADLVKFHAVCKPWRNSPDHLSRKKTAKQLLPWLLHPTESSSLVRLRCIFSKSSYHVQPPCYPGRTNWVCSADGTTIWYLTIKKLQPTLHDPITGAVTELPPFPHMHYFDGHSTVSPCGVLYGDGTTLLYSFSVAGSMSKFNGALLHPSNLKWTFLSRVVETSGRKQGEFCVAYHAGRILLTMDSRTCHVIMPDNIADVLVRRPRMIRSCLEEQYNYILESREETSEPEKARWLLTEGHCLADRLLFLGSPNSFSIDASLVGSQGGYAYFVYHNNEILDASPQQLGVFRYNFVDGKAEFIEGLPQEWDNEKCTWLVPQPTMAPIQEIIERKQQKTAPITSPAIMGASFSVNTAKCQPEK